MRVISKLREVWMREVKMKEKYSCKKGELYFSFR